MYSLNLGCSCNAYKLDIFDESSPNWSMSASRAVRQPLSSVYLLPRWAHALLLLTLEPPAILFSVWKFPKHQYFVSGYTMLVLQISIMLVCPKCVHLLLLICCSAEKLPCCGLTWRRLLHVDTIAGPTCYWPRKLPQGARVQRYWRKICSNFELLI